MNVRRTGTLLLAGSLAACVGPTYQRPQLDLPAAFTAPAPPAPPPPADWWRGFGAPQLNRLIEQAEQNSPDVQAAAARVIQADQAARVAGSPLLPGISAGASQDYQRVGAGKTVIGANGAHYTDSRSYGAQLSASYEVDFWGKNRDALHAAEASALASRYDQQTVWLTTVSAIASSYFQAIGYRDRLAIARRNVHDALEILQAYMARLEVGTANALDVSQQEALVAGYRAQIPALDSQYRQLVISLAILVGTPPERIQLGPARLAELKLPPVAAFMPGDILRRRPDVANAEAQLIAQNENVRQAVANFFPSLQLTASGGVTSAALSAITGPGTLLASLASQLTQTVFDNGAKSGTLGEARGRYQELSADYAKSVLQALSDVETALTTTSLTTEQEALETEAVRTARRSADIARAQLAAGTVDIISVLNTENTLFSDLDNLAQVRVSRFVALVSLYKALGGGWSLPADATPAQAATGRH